MTGGLLLGPGFYSGVWCPAIGILVPRHPGASQTLLDALPLPACADQQPNKGRNACAQTCKGLCVELAVLTIL